MKLELTQNLYSDNRLNKEKMRKVMEKELHVRT
jgi:hypothetical protein